jgi:phosphatidylserine/phosphatidylglycerophosphate/cardiolipin synthase-like enzyme
MMTPMVRLTDNLLCPTFLPAFRTCRRQPIVQPKPSLLATAGQVENLFGPALAQTKQTAIVCSFLLARDTLLDAAEKAHRRGARTYWLTCDTRVSKMFDPYVNPARAAQDLALRHEFSLMLDDCVVRFGPFHAKFILIDPTTPDRAGWLTSANLIAEAADQNVEAIVKLSPREVALAYEVTRHVFWHESQTEVISEGNLASLPGSPSFSLPTPDAELLWTVGNKAHPLRQAAGEIVDGARRSLTLAGYTWQQNHPLLAKVAKQAKAGVEVTIFVRETSDLTRSPRKTLNVLLEAGAKVYSVPGLHAKFLLSESDGLMGTANFAAKGLDEGFEVGLRLKGDRLEQAREALAWMQAAATEEVVFCPEIGPESFQSGHQFHHPSRPEVTYKLEERRVLPVRQLVANCASSLAAEAQAELDLALSKIAQTKNPRGDWCTEEGNVVKLYREISLSVEMSPPTVPLKLRNPKLPKDEPQFVKFAGQRWIAIPAIEGDQVLLQAAKTLATKEQARVAYWDKNP